MANDQPNGTSRDDDLRLQVSSEDLLLDIDPNVPLEFLKKAQALSGKLPPRKAPRDLLVETHNSHVQKQLGRPKATNLVKKPILALAYPASYKPMAELEKVSRWSLSFIVVPAYYEMLACHDILNESGPPRQWLWMLTRCAPDATQ
jgi:hypothetical protein